MTTRRPEPYTPELFGTVLADGATAVDLWREDRPASGPTIAAAAPELAPATSTAPDAPCATESPIRRTPLTACRDHYAATLATIKTGDPTMTTIPNAGPIRDAYKSGAQAAVAAIVADLTARADAHRAAAARAEHDADHADRCHDLAAECDALAARMAKVARIK